MSCRLTALAAALALSAPARPDPLYVIEQLVVNVNSAPDASGERIATVKSGERVEALERQRDEVRVRLPNGTEGWIRASYLSAEEPLRARLAQRDAELSQLRETVSRLEAQPRPASPAASAATVATTAPTQPEDPSATLFSASTPAAPRRLWPWVLGTSLVAFLAGMGLGALLLDRRIRRRFGGLRVY